LLFLGRMAKRPLCCVFLFTHDKNSLSCIVFVDARQRKKPLSCISFYDAWQTNRPLPPSPTITHYFFRSHCRVLRLSCIFLQRMVKYFFKKIDFCTSFYFYTIKILFCTLYSIFNNYLTLKEFCCILILTTSA
jgi:hypothetical protein